jgi:hypothetical protein
MTEAVGSWYEFVFNFNRSPAEAGAAGQKAGEARGALDNGVNTPPSDGVTPAPGNPGPQLSQSRPLSGRPVQLGDFGLPAVSVQQIAQLIQVENLESRKTARQDRQQARDVDIAAQQAVADEIRRAADFTLAATCVTSAFQMLGGIAQIGGAGVALKTLGANPTQADMAIAGDQSGLGKGIGDGLGGLGGIVGAVLNYQAGQAEAKKAELQAESTKMRTRAEDETDFIRAYQENCSAVREKLAALQQAEADTNRQIVRG